MSIESSGGGSVRECGGKDKRNYGVHSFILKYLRMMTGS